MDAFELLKADHKKVAKLFDSLEAASRDAKLAVFKQIKSELDVHAHVEETIFYPVLEGREETHDLTLEAYEEHKVVKLLLAELARGNSADDQWQAKAKVLREKVEHHVQEEENELFDKADDALSSEESEKLGQRMEAEKARQQGRPAARPAAAKSTKTFKAGQSEPGILSKLAGLVGLGTGPAKKRTAKKSRVQKTAARKSKKAGTKTGSKKSTKKAASTATRKATAKGRGAKRTPARSGRPTRKKSGQGATKKAKKK